MVATWLAPIMTAGARPQPASLARARRASAIKPAGATAQLLLALESRPQRFWSRREILAALPEKKSLNWSLRYCYAMGWIEHTQDARASRYLRYRITAPGMRALHE